MWGLPWGLLGTSSLFTTSQGFLLLMSGSSSCLLATLRLLSEIGETQDLGNLFLLVLHVAGAGLRAGQTAWGRWGFFLRVQKQFFSFFVIIGVSDNLRIECSHSRMQHTERHTCSCRHTHTYTHIHNHAMPWFC